MTPAEVNVWLAKFAREFPKQFRKRDMLPRIANSFNLASALKTKAAKTGMPKALQERIDRLTTMADEFKRDPDGIVKGDPLRYETIKALTGPYLEMSAQDGNLDVQNKAWNALVADLKNIPSSFVEVVTRPLDITTWGIRGWVGAAIAIGGAWYWLQRNRDNRPHTAGLLRSMRG